MKLSPKEVVCDCGHSQMLDRSKLMCTKCGKYMFYDPRDKRKHKINKAYTVILIAAAMGFVAYIFIEMIVDPLLG